VKYLPIERNLLISLLKLTQKGAIEQKNVYSEARVPEVDGRVLIKKMQTNNLINLRNDLVNVEPQSRLVLAFRAVELGADIEQISHFLKWQEFEAMTAVALQLNGYTTANNVHFTYLGKRWELDVVGCRKPLVLCVDCKHWSQGLHLSSLKKIVLAQTQRTKAFTDSIPNGKFSGECTRWNKATFIPIVVSLFSFRQKFCDQVPIVPVLQLQDFISHLPLNLDSVVCFSREIGHL
jgi:hypothetical protein